ncbi:hypothetical protein BH11BAC1_BH11BAC1_00770 [soil metagenome]
MKKAVTKIDLKKLVDELPDNLLEEVYKLVWDKKEGAVNLLEHLDKTIKEDAELLKKLAK